MIRIEDLLIFLAVFIGFCFAVAIGVLLIIALVNFIKVTRKVDKLLDDNTEYVNKTVKQLPSLVENLDKATISIKENADTIGYSAGAIGGIFSGTPATGEDSSLLLTIVSIAEAVIKVIMGFFTKKD